MQNNIVLLLLVVVVPCFLAYKVAYYEQTVDHFNYFPTRPATFKQRYVMEDKYYKKELNGPLFFYCGNEGDIFMFCM